MGVSSISHGIAFSHTISLGYNHNSICRLGRIPCLRVGQAWDLPALAMRDGVQRTEGCFSYGMMSFIQCCLAQVTSVCVSCHEVSEVTCGQTSAAAVMFCSCVDHPTMKDRIQPIFLTGAGATAHTNSILTSRVDWTQRLQHTTAR